MKKLLLLPCISTIVTFSDKNFELVQCDEVLTISQDSNNFVEVTLVNQQVAYKATILGGFSSSEVVHGVIDYKSYFTFMWEDDQETPRILFKKQPGSIQRNYQKGMKVELGIEDVPHYKVSYNDSVTADFIQTGDNSYDFVYSTGFDGNIWKEEDGSHVIRFKGIRLDADEDGYESESKFIISRSKYTDNLILILQDGATVYLKS